MSVFAIGDTHLPFGVKKPMDIFPGWQDYVERLETNWRKLVKPEDTVVIPGDISWAMSLEESKDDLAFLDALPGTKLLLKGNHDYWWATRRKMEQFLQENGFSTLQILHNNAIRCGELTLVGSRGWFFDAENDPAGKVLLREAGRLRMSIEEGKRLGGELVCFLHYPPLTLTQQCDVLLDVLKDSGVTRLYYGHLHGPSTSLAFQGVHDRVQYRLVSADFLKFSPLLVEKF